MESTLAEWFPIINRVLLKLLPGGLLCVWCLWAIDWRKAWPVLRDGGLAPLVLIGLMSAAVWSLVWPRPLPILGLGAILNGVWQVGAVAVLIGVVLLCGWLQSRSGYAPPEFDLDEPAHDAGHAHEHHAVSH